MVRLLPPLLLLLLLSAACAGCRRFHLHALAAAPAAARVHWLRLPAAAAPVGCCLLGMAFGGCKGWLCQSLLSAARPTDARSPIAAACKACTPSKAGPRLTAPHAAPLAPAGLDDVTLGTLEDLKRSGKGGMDPNGLGTSRLASDVLWSDPVGERGFQPNVARGVGMCFGPDVTEVRAPRTGWRCLASQGSHRPAPPPVISGLWPADSPLAAT